MVSRASSQSIGSNLESGEPFSPPTRFIGRVRRKRLNQLRHHRTLDAKASRLNWIIRLAQNINDAPIFEMNFQAAQRVTELTGTVHYRVWLQRD